MMSNNMKTNNMVAAGNNMGGNMGYGGQGGASFDKARIQNAVNNHMRDKVMKIDDDDVRTWALVSNVPQVSKPVAIIQVILNFLLPGFGTMVAACSSERSVSKT